MKVGMPAACRMNCRRFEKEGRVKPAPAFMKQVLERREAAWKAEEAAAEMEAAALAAAAGREQHEGMLGLWARLCCGT